ncbi:hypothetical protein C5C18_01680 [Rathayibacter tritici]|uniref:Uncharacterized protein n=1 Tax=Rathayibacter tritici TaxID=33888 RepID=A0A160KW07_9MICO|nr:hypothetical protein [Rathayibacter tritici]AND17927.1 hypothetical protein A6122_2818 [Rathayibacter tritici]PPF28585.1 hypothetical protein C5C06_07705 [Rathayibacter tritici]PPF69851.1 hypothetical protein C5C21_02570 [Rathayibacter tritici]PPG09116.1 hypothetical protein C5C18_01680 [Rathayibacter tritici]PPI18011.1 hypothetical protein C5D07_03935 [Rathayibacter tritici]
MNDSIPDDPRTTRIDDGWSNPAAESVHRRVFVKGAAWAVPVVAVSLATPAAAASGSPTLTFTEASYRGSACTAITGVQVSRTTDGSTADAGKTITVTLKDGYTFAGGKTTYSGTTDSKELLTLPDITVPADGGTSRFGASSDSLSTSAPVSAPASTAARNHQWNTSDGGAVEDYPNIPKDSKAVGYGFFLTPDNELWWKTRKTAIAKSVTSAVGEHVDSTTADYVTYTTADGNFQWDTTGEDGTLETYPKIPKKSKAVGYGFFLTPDNELWWKKRETAIATNVTSAVGEHVDSTMADYVTYTTADGNYQWNSADGGTLDTFPNIAKNSKAVGYGFFLTPDNELWWKTQETAVAKNVTSAVGEHVDSTMADYATLTTADGNYQWKSGGKEGTLTTFAKVPSNSKAVGYGFFLTPDKELWWKTRESAVAKNVTSAVGEHGDSSMADYATYTTEPSCS